MMMSGKNYKFPFTAAQWQELEHQALIFKYMVSGLPLPPDLLFTIRRSRSYLDPALAPQQLFSSNVGWNCFKMGLGKNIDPEPGRCRRTDGKKWRCSKEAYADSKYCERHMHRGKNRSRKPVEVLKTTSITNKNLYSSQASSTTHSLSSLSPHDHPFLNYHDSSSSSRSTTGLGLSNQDSNTTLFLDSGFYSHSTDTDYNRGISVYGVKAEEVDNEHGFFPEQPLGTNMRDFSVSSSMNETWQLTPLNMSCSSSSKSQRSKEGSYLQLQSFNDSPKEQSQDHHQQYFDVLMSNKIIKNERKEETQKTIHRFFDEWPIRKEKDSWLDLDDNKSSKHGSVSTTQLSISIPSYDHFA